PKFRARVEAALTRMNADDELHAAGVKTIIVVEGKRELTTQMAYYCRGRMKDIADVKAMFAAAGLWALTDKEAITPSTWTLKSRHLDGKAVDLAPSKDGTEIWWDAPDAVWKRMSDIAQSYGLESGYTWAAPKQDRPHFEEKL
ncbi:MAG: M15 family metallopeptidase, partial [Rectinema sp.]